MNQQTTNVFVSSTSKDLATHRAVVREAIGQLGCCPVMMEDFGAQDGDATRVSLKEVSGCDIFVGIYAYRYGYRPDGGTSVTELEYDEAEQRGIPRLIFVIDENASQSYDGWEKLDKYRETDPDAIERLRQFKARVGAKLVWDTFTSPEDLATRVTSALRNCRAWRIPRYPAVPKEKKYIGQEVLLAQLRSAMQPSKRIALSGMGGIGKTWTARCLAESMRDIFTGGVLWVTFGTEAKDADVLLSTTMRDWIQYHHPGRITPVEALKPKLVRGWLEEVYDRQGPLLIVFDDIWYAGPAQRLLGELVPSAASVLLTTRHTAIAADQLGLSMIIEIRELDEADGTAMLRNRVTSNNSLSDVRRIVNLLHGHPLMLEIIAGQIKCKVAEGDFGYIEKLPSLLEERLKNGSNQGVLGDDPYAIVQGVFNLSYQNMPPKVQRRFRALGILAPDVLVRAHILSATWNDHIDTSTGREESQDYMRTLSQTCMLSQEPDGYTQHALLREYAHALLVREGEEPEVKEHYLGYIVARLAPKFETLPQEQWKLAIDPDLPHIRYVGNLLADNLQSWVNSNQPGENEAVPDWLGDKIASLEALAQPQPPAVLPTLSPGDQAGLTLVQQGADFCAATHKYMFQYYLGDQGRNWLQMGLACARIVEDKKREMLFASVLGSWYANNGQHQVALSYHQAAEHYAQVLKQWADAAVAKNNEAESCRITGQFQKALDLYQQVHKIFTLLGDHEAIAVVSTNLSETCLTLGQIEEASRHAERARRHMDLITDRSRKGDILNALGRIHGAKREFMEALDLYQQALAIHQEVGNRKGEAAAYNNIGLMYDELHELAKAAETYQKSLSISLEIGDRLSEAATRNNIAWVHHQRGDIEQAVDQFNQAIRLCHDMQAVAHESGYLFNLAAVLYRSLPETHDALRLVIQSVALLELHNLPCDATGCPIEKQRAFLARLREEVSSARAENKGKKPSDTTFQFEATDRSKNSVGFFQQMGSLAQESGDQLAAAAALNNEGEMRRVVGDYQQAMKLFQEAFDLFRKNADKKGEATVLNNLGLLYYNLNDLQRALGLYQQALPLRREVGDRAGEAATLNNIGLVYDSAGQSQRALEFYKQALPIRREVNDRGGEATTLHNIGAAYYSLSNLQCALEYYQKALPLRREAGDRPGEATTLFNMAMVHYQGKQFSLAANMFEQAATLYHGLGAFPTEALSLFYVAQTLHSGLRRTSEAIESMLRAIAVFERNNLLQDTAGQMLERYYAHLAAMQSDQRNLHR